MPATPTMDEVELAAERLARSGRGRQSLKSLLTWLNESGISLDADNQAAVITLLNGIWGPFTMSGRDAILIALQRTENTIEV